MHHLQDQVAVLSHKERPDTLLAPGGGYGGLALATRWGGESISKALGSSELSSAVRSLQATSPTSPIRGSVERVSWYRFMSYSHVTRPIAVRPRDSRHYFGSAGWLICAVVRSEVRSRYHLRAWRSDKQGTDPQELNQRHAYPLFLFVAESGADTDPRRACGACVII